MGDAPATTTPKVAEQRLTPNRTAPRKARAFVDEFLREVDADHLEEPADLLTSELVTDAVRHRPSQVSVRCAYDDGVVRVEVSDNPGIVEDPLAGYLERRVGRRLASELAKRWGSELERSRTVTWFELAVD